MLEFLLVVFKGAIEIGLELIIVVMGLCILIQHGEKHEKADKYGEEYTDENDC